MSRTLADWAKGLGAAFLFLLVLPFLLVVLPVALPGNWLYGRFLRRRFWLQWGVTGRPLLFVYSNSPNWQPYIEQNWLPRLQRHAVVLNWSERAQWIGAGRIEAKVFRHFGGTEDFNPMAIYVPRRGNMQTIRFWQAFKDFKHGDEVQLRLAEGRLFAVLDELQQAPA